MKFGLTPEQFSEIERTIVRPLIAKGARVYCFGSRARGDHRAFSDLDLMVESGTLNDLELGALVEKMRSGNFPFKVDLVHLSEFADSYRAGYEAEKIPFVEMHL